MSERRLVLALLFVGCALLATAPSSVWADGAVVLTAPPQVTPVPLIPGREAIVTLKVKTGKESANQVLLQIMLGPNLVGQFKGASLGADQANTYTVKISVPPQASGSLVFAIWAQGLRIGQLAAQTQQPGLAAQAPPVGIAPGLRGTVAISQVKSLAIDPAVIIAGTSAQGTVALETPAPPQGVVVNLASSNPGVSVPSSVTVAGGAAMATFTVMAMPNAPAGNVAISAVMAGSAVAKQATVGVGAAVQVHQLWKYPGACPSNPRAGDQSTSTPLQSGDTCVLVVTLDSAVPGGGASINLSSSNPAVTVPSNVMVQAGQTQAQFTATIAGGAAGAVTITAVRSGPGGVAKSATLIVQASQLSDLVLPDRLEPASTYTGTVSMTGMAGAGGVNVNLSSSSAAITVPPSVTIPAGAAMATFGLTVGSTPPAGNVTIGAVISGPGNTVKQKTLTVGVAQVARVSFPQATTASTGALVPPNIYQGLTAQGTVYLDAAAGTGVSVNLSSSSPEVTVPSTVTVPAGTTHVAFTAAAREGAQPGNVTITGVRTGAGNAAKQQTVIVKVNQVVGLGSFSQFELRVGNTATGSVQLETIATGSGVVVNLSSGEPNALSVPASVTVPTGQTKATFTVTATGSPQQDTNCNVYVSAVRSGQPNSDAKSLNVAIVPTRGRPCPF